MLMYELTLKTYGYEIQSLSGGSNKPICVICDYCQKSYITNMKQRTKANQLVDKDGCKSCRFKKRADVSMVKYGVSNSSQKPEVRRKISEKNSDRLKSDEYKQLIKNKNMEKYGCESAMQSEEIKVKYKQAFIDKYGVDNPSKLEEVKDKRKETCQTRFGTEYASQSDLGKKLMKEGCQKKYGVDNAFQSEEVKDKIKETTLKKYGVKHHIQRPGVAEQIQQKGLKTKIDNGDVKVYDSKTYPKIADSIGFSSSHFYTLVKRYGIEKAITLVPHESSLEVQMGIWLDELKVVYQKQFRVDGKIADFYIPSHNIIIETDGLYWHSDAIIKDKCYHTKKRQLYIDNGYTPLFFRGDELINKFPIIKSVILNKLGMTERVGARQCKLIDIDKKIGKQFMVDNHLMGSGRGQCFGLEHDGRIISLLCIKRLKDKNYEISRFCSLLNYSIVGGFSRLLKYAQFQLDMDTLITFIDLRYGTGLYLSSLGFVKNNTYPSFRWTDGKQTFHRMSFPSNTGYEQGLAKIWDCGQAKWILSKNGV